MGLFKHLRYQQKKGLVRPGLLQTVAAGLARLDRYGYFICLFLLGTVTACGQSANSTPAGAIQRSETVELPTSQPPAAPSPVNTRVLPLEPYMPVPTQPLTPTLTPIPAETRGLVVQVVDGDTVGIVLEGDPPTRVYLVKYIGIDAPPNTPDDPWGVVAFETNRKLTNLKVVRLVRDSTEFDGEGRLLRYVYVGEKLMSVALAEQGLARAERVEPDTRLAGQIEQAETQARNAQLGLWGRLPTPTPGLSRPTTPGQSPVATLTVTVTVASEATAIIPAGTSTGDRETTPANEATVEGEVIPAVTSTTEVGP
ncbi:MAG: thermonuclease family protein [Chloroflexota bacterium]